MCQPVSAYEPFYIPKLTLLSGSTLNREVIFNRSETVEVMRSVLRKIQRRIPFRLVAYVYLRDRFHLLLDFSTAQQSQHFMKLLIDEFEVEYQSLMGEPRRIPVWHQRPEIKPVQSLEEFGGYLDAIHYEPVRRNKAKRPEEWPYSSYEIWVERGIYKLGWGWTEPESVRRIRLG